MTGISPPPTLSCARPAAQSSTAPDEPPLYAGEHDPRNGALAAGSGPLLRVMAEVIARSDG